MALRYSAEQLIFAQPIVQTAVLAAGLSKYPTTPGQHVIILNSNNLFSIPSEQFDEVLTFVQRYAGMVKRILGVRRCGLAYDGFQNIHIIPMHGLSENWTPIKADETPMITTYPGFLWTKSSPQVSEEELDKVQHKLTAISGWKTPNHQLIGDANNGNLFARLIRGEIPQWRVWEDDSHVAFLTPFANTPGFTVLIPRKHLSSDILSLSGEDFVDLVQAVRKVATVLMSGMNTTRVGLFFEGYEIDYAHAKLIPVLDDSTHPEGPSTEYYDTYPGHITTKLGPEQDSSSLRARYNALQEYLKHNPLAVNN